VNSDRPDRRGAALRARQARGKAKLFHPYLATRDIDWYAALIGALPQVRSAKTSEEYRAAIDAMLAALGDPETQTSLSEARTAASQAAAVESAEDVRAKVAPPCFQVIASTAAPRLRSRRQGCCKATVASTNVRRSS
jgi:hypothetical protein